MHNKKVVNKNFPKKIQTLDCLGKDFKSAITNMFKELRETMIKS